MQPPPGIPPSQGFRWPELRQTALETTLTLAGVALFLALLYQLWPFLTPPLLACAIVVLLWPLRKQRGVHALLLTSGLIFLVWLSYTLSAYIIPFGIVFLVAYLFNPVVSHVHERWNWPRWASSLIVTLLIVSTITLLFLFLVPTLIDQIETLGTRAIQSARDLNEWILTAPIIDKLAFLGVERQVLADQFAGAIQGRLLELTSGIPNAFQRVMLSIKPVFTVITMVVVTPVILFYTLKDYATIKHSLVRLMPKFNGRRLYIKRIGSVIGNYLRGQLTISAIAALLISVGLLIAEVPFALLIGIMAGMLNMIPSLGLILTNIIGICIALIFGERGLVDVVLVVGVILGESLLEQAILQPKILSHQVGLHPVAILLSLFFFGYFFGIIGLFVAVPITALARRLLNEYQEELTLDLNFHIALQPPAPGVSYADLPEMDPPMAGNVTYAPEVPTKGNGAAADTS